MYSQVYDYCLSQQHLSQDSAEASEEELKRKEEAEWRARVQEEWADETAGMWEENTTWDEQGTSINQSI